MPSKSVKEINPNFKQLLAIWWALIWRNLLVSIVGMLVMLIVGYVIGFVLAFVGVPEKLEIILTVPLGFVLGMAFTLIPLKMVIGKDFRDFRLVLLKK